MLTVSGALGAVTVCRVSNKSCVN